MRQISRQNEQESPSHLYNLHAYYDEKKKFFALALGNKYEKHMQKIFYIMQLAMTLHFARIRRSFMYFNSWQMCE
jgi:hypothetical protein